ncbi:MAG: transposase [Planctomyces sp.]|nr:transposase [Planctomyces sp.]
MPEFFDSFQRNPPPGFRGLRMDVPVEFYVRHLPHWRQAEATYFVTFRLNDALHPQQLKKLVELKQQFLARTPRPLTDEHWTKYARDTTRRIERWLDQGYGACYFADPANSQLLADSLQHYHETRCETHSYVVMLNHAHAIMKPLGDYTLEDTLGLIKGYVANQINLRNDTEGSIWAQESYDTIIRNGTHLENAIQYIGRNGTKAKLPPEKYRRWINPTWEQAGWKFFE